MVYTAISCWKNKLDLEVLKLCRVANESAENWPGELFTTVLKL